MELNEVDQFLVPGTWFVFILHMNVQSSKRRSLIFPAILYKIFFNCMLFSSTKSKALLGAKANYSFLIFQFNLSLYFFDNIYVEH